MVVRAIICTLFQVFSLSSIYLILGCVKCWHDTVHLGLLACAQAPSVSKTELLEYYLISRGYYSGFVHVCFCERTTQGVNPKTEPETLHL